MELPHLGQQCLEATCHKLDFLPMKCDACSKIFCNEHYTYSNHNCPLAYKKNVQVPVCPLCNALIPVPRNQLPDVVVGAHIDNDCQSDPAKTRRKAYTNKCSAKGCKIKEIVPVLCQECKLNYCLKHRHPSDHKCEGKLAAQRRIAAEMAAARQRVNNSTQSNVSKIQENMSEDEALARALALSLQEDHDRALAESLQNAERRTRLPNRQGSRANDRCALS